MKKKDLLARIEALEGEVRYLKHTQCFCYSHYYPWAVSPEPIQPHPWPYYPIIISTTTGMASGQTTLNESGDFSE